MTHSKTSKTPARKHNRKNVIMALFLVVALLVTGAFAYLTDKDSATNVFTVGDVAIDLTEPSWDEENGKDMWAGKVIDKDPQIENTGDNDAFIYVMVTVPKADDIKLFDEFDEAEDSGTITKNDYQLFTYDLNAPIADPATNGWTLIDSKIDNNDANNYYLYAYNAVLKPNETTVPVFNKIEFANVIEGQFPADNNLSVNINAYAIQSNFGDGTIVKDPTDPSKDVWTLYVNQNGWQWPSEPTGPHYSYVSYDETTKKSIAYNKNNNDSSTISDDIITIRNTPVSSSFTLNGYSFEGWTDERGRFYEPGTEGVSVNTLFIEDSETREIINPNPVFREKLSVVIQGSGTTGIPVKLVPVDNTSTAMIERTDSNGTVVESYNDGYSVITDTYGYDETPSSYNEWYVYGLAEDLTIDELFASYVKVQGDGYAKITTVVGKMAGTGTLIEVYDRHGTDVTTDDTLVEKFYVIIYGDVNGDAEVTLADPCIINEEAVGLTNWSIKLGGNYVAYKFKAANIRSDKTINATDASLVRDHINGINTINQITGTTV